MKKMIGRMSLSVLVVGLCVCCTGSSTSAGEIFSDSFDQDTEGMPPSQWEQSANWNVVSWGGNKMIENLSTEATSTTQYVVHRFSNAVPDVWCVDFHYGWQWGGDVPGDSGNYPYVVHMDMLDSRQNGYRVAVHQGVQLGGTPDDLIQIYRVRSGEALNLLAQGKGFNHAGWKGQGKSEACLYPIRLERRMGGLLTAYRGVENGWEAVATATDKTYCVFAEIRLGASGWNGSEVPELDGVKVTVGP